MGFYIRKSLSFGPLRFNLSSSGVGVSAGVKGFRVGTGPRGNYIHAGMGGLYYRQTLGSNRRTTRRELAPSYSPPPEAQTGTIEQMVEIESADATQMVDNSAAALLLELNSKRSLFRFGPVALLACIASIAVTFANPHWAWITLDVLLAGLTGFCFWWDQQRKTTILFYNLEPPILPGFESLHNAFEALARCGGKWHVDAEAAVYDRKYHAGADSTVKRSTAHFQIKAPPFVKTNIPIMCLPAGRQNLYLFPDRILVYDSKGIGAVSYSSLRLTQNPTKFLERDGVPFDAQVVGRSWHYVNKDGGPDRRFRDNREIPIAVYTELFFKSATGLNELFMFSNQAAATCFRSAMETFRDSFASIGPSSPPPYPIPEPLAGSVEYGSNGIEPPPPIVSAAPPVLTEVEQRPNPTRKFYFFGQGVQGPYTPDELTLFAQQGIIAAETQICSMDNQQWINYADFIAGQNGSSEAS
jgi:hypothetical protein